MDDAIYQAVVEELRRKGHHAEVYERYSGRGMHGDTTTGIVTDAPGVLLGVTLIREAKELDYSDELIFDTDLPLREDDMGKYTIYY